VVAAVQNSTGQASHAAHEFHGMNLERLDRRERKEDLIGLKKYLN